MPLKCNKNVTSYDNVKVTKQNDSRKNKPRKKREHCYSPPGAGALLRHDVFQPVRVGGKALDWKFRRKVTPLRSYESDPLFRWKATP